MAGDTVITVVGNLTADPELRASKPAPAKAPKPAAVPATPVSAAPAAS